MTIISEVTTRCKACGHFKVVSLDCEWCAAKADEDAQRSNLALVRKWLLGPKYGHEKPTEDTFLTAVTVLIGDYRGYQRDGLDVMSSAVLDEMIQTLEAMR